MAKNTNPLTKSLLIKQSWNTLTLPLQNKGGNNELIKENFIKKIINGTFLKLGLLTSDIHISKNCIDFMTIQFMYYPLINKLTGKSINNKYIVELIKLIKLLFKLKYPTKEFKFVCIKAPNKFIEPKILNDYIHYSVMDDPNKIKFILLNLIREYRTSLKKN